MYWGLVAFSFSFRQQTSLIKVYYFSFHLACGRASGIPIHSCSSTTTNRISFSCSVRRVWNKSRREVLRRTPALIVNKTLFRIMRHANAEPAICSGEPHYATNYYANRSLSNTLRAKRQGFKLQSTCTRLCQGGAQLLFSVSTALKPRVMNRKLHQGRSFAPIRPQISDFTEVLERLKLTNKFLRMCLLHSTNEFLRH